MSADALRTVATVALGLAVSALGALALRSGDFAGGIMCLQAGGFVLLINDLMRRLEA